MAMKAKITAIEVNKAVVEIKKGIEVFGAQYSPRFAARELAEMLVVAVREGNYDAPTRDEYTKLARQLAACTSREKGLRNKLSEGEKHVDFGNDVENLGQTGS
jgi:hypothetical protein